MKLFKSVFLALVTFIFSTGSLAMAEAGAGGHGGDGIKSSVKQVESAIAYAMKNDGVTDVFQRIQKEMNQKGEALHISNPRYREVFTRMLGSGFPATNYNLIPVLHDIAVSKLNIKEDGPCKDTDGKDKDASVASYEPGSDICFSVPRLRRFAPKKLAQTVTSLAVHELSHHFGVKDEGLANELQTFVYDNIYSTCRIRIFLKGSDPEIWSKFEIVPKDWASGPTTYLGDTVQATREFIYTKKGGEVHLTSDNSSEEFQMEIYRNKDSVLRFTALNGDLTKSPIEVRFKLPQVQKTENSGLLFVYPKEGLTVHGSYNGKPLDEVEDLSVDSECFYTRGAQIWY